MATPIGELAFLENNDEVSASDGYEKATNKATEKTKRFILKREKVV